MMFAVLFEVHPDTDQWDAYLGYATMLRPDLEAIDGFVDNIRYRSLTRPGWILVGPPTHSIPTRRAVAIPR
jgi:hypothetical protein